MSIPLNYSVAAVEQASGRCPDSAELGIFEGCPVDSANFFAFLYRAAQRQAMTWRAKRSLLEGIVAESRGSVLGSGVRVCWLIIQSVRSTLAPPS